MARDWSQSEVEAIVGDYFRMLEAELRGEAYSKTTHRTRLAERLDNRSPSSIEYKHQNISAALIDLGFPYITGYKPYVHYQGLLGEIVGDFLERHPELHRLAEQRAQEPAEPPNVADILAIQVEPPEQSFVRVEQVASGLPPWKSRRFPVNYLEREARNQSLGNHGEDLALRYEQARLIHLGRDRLADQVERVPQTLGDSAGFDIRSFESNGRDRFIEVKTTKYGRDTPFYVTRNELRFSRDREDQYHLYRLFEFQRAPRLFSLQGALDQSFQLAPVQYMARR